MSKFSNYGKKGRTGYGRYGEGEGIRPENFPRDVPLRFFDFAGGYFSADAREDIPENTSPYAPNIEVDSKDRIMRAPGTTSVETLTGRTPSQMAVHHSLDGTAELLFFDPPFLGIKSTGPTVWYDLGLTAFQPYRWSHYGEDFVFSNGYYNVFKRTPNEEGATTIEAPFAATYASFAGRLWAAHADIGGRIEPLGIRWNAAASLPDDWDGLGSGFELILDDALAGDRVVALRTMGFDTMAVINRRSIWVGRRTGIANRPADFSPRIPGTGAVNAETVVTTRHGVILLSDNGVYLFDGNRAEMISQAINADLLPLDMTQLNSYHSFYDPFKKFFYLFTPTQTFTLDVEKKRWFHRTYTVTSAALFAPQVVGEIWDTDVQAWDLDETPWDTYDPSILPDLLFLGDVAGAATLVEEDYASETAFGDIMSAIWEFRLVQNAPMNILATVKRVLWEFINSGTIRVSVPNNESQYEVLFETDLAASAVPKFGQQPVLHTGRGIGARIELVTGSIRISKFELLAMVRSEIIDAGAFTPREYYSDFQ